MEQPFGLGLRSAVRGTKYPGSGNGTSSRAQRSVRLHHHLDVEPSPTHCVVKELGTRGGEEFGDGVLGTSDADPVPVRDPELVDQPAVGNDARLHHGDPQAAFRRQVDGCQRLIGASLPAQRGGAGDDRVGSGPQGRGTNELKIVNVGLGGPVDAGQHPRPLIAAQQALDLPGRDSGPERLMPGDQALLAADVVGCSTRQWRRWTGHQDSAQGTDGLWGRGPANVDNLRRAGVRLAQGRSTCAGSAPIPRRDAAARPISRADERIDSRHARHIRRQMLRADVVDPRGWQDEGRSAPATRPGPEPEVTSRRQRRHGRQHDHRPAR